MILLTNEFEEVDKLKQFYSKAKKNGANKVMFKLFDSENILTSVKNLLNNKKSLELV